MIRSILETINVSIFVVLITILVLDSIQHGPTCKQDVSGSPEVLRIREAEYVFPPFRMIIAVVILDKTGTHFPISSEESAKKGGIKAG